MKLDSNKLLEQIIRDNLFESNNSNPGKSVSIDFFKKLVKKLGVTWRPAHAEFFTAWQAAEDTNANWNPLATTYPGKGLTWSQDPGMTEFNTSAGVKNFTSETAGVEATYQTLLSSRYSKLRGKITDNNSNALSMAYITDEIAIWSGGSGTYIINQLQDNNFSVNVGNNSISEKTVKSYFSVEDLGIKKTNPYGLEIRIKKYKIENKTAASVNTNLGIPLTQTLTGSDLNNYNNAKTHINDIIATIDNILQTKENDRLAIEKLYNTEVDDVLADKTGIGTLPSTNELWTSDYKTKKAKHIHDIYQELNLATYDTLKIIKSYPDLVLTYFLLDYALDILTKNFYTYDNIKEADHIMQFSVQHPCYSYDTDGNLKISSINTMNLRIVLN